MHSNLLLLLLSSMILDPPVHIILSRCYVQWTLVYSVTQSHLYYFEQLVMHSTPFCWDRWQQPSRSNNTTTPPWVAVPIKTQVLNYSNIKTETKTIPLKLCSQLLYTLRLYAQILICFCISSWMDCSSGSHLVLGWSVYYALVTSYEYIVRAYIRWPLNIDIENSQ